MEKMNLNFKNNMIDSGLIARCVLSKMFNVKERDIVFMNCRKKNKVAARRFYIYYLWKYKDIRHNRMCEWIHNIHHATSIYQCRILEKEIDTYRSVRKNFLTFIYYADRNEWEKMKIDMRYSMKELNDLDFKSKYIEILNLN